MKESPVGALPRFIWIEQRLDDLNRAIRRYINAGVLPMQEWLDEKLELEKWLRDRQAQHRVEEAMRPGKKSPGVD